MNITDIERQEWAHHPVTQEFVQNLLTSRQETLETWAKQGYSTELSNASALGGIQVLDQVIEVIESCKTLVVNDKGESIHG